MKWFRWIPLALIGVACAENNGLTLFSNVAARGSTVVFLAKNASGTIDLLSYDATSEHVSTLAQLPENGIPSTTRVRVCGDAIVVLINNDVYYVPPNSVDATAIVVDPPGMIVDAVADDAFVYVLGWGELDKVPLQGGAFISLATDILSPISIAVDAQNVYWSQTNDGVGGNVSANGAIRSMTKNGGPATFIATDVAEPSDVVAGNDRLFWIERGLEDIGRIEVLDLVTNTTSIVASELPSVRELSLNEQSVLVSIGGSSVINIPTDGSTSDVVYEADGKSVLDVQHFAVLSSKVVIAGRTTDGTSKLFTQAF